MDKKLLYDYKIRVVKERSFIMIDITTIEGLLAEGNVVNEIVDFICQKEFINPVEHYVIWKLKDKGYFKHDYATGLSECTNESHWLRAAIKTLNM